MKSRVFSGSEFSRHPRVWVFRVWGPSFRGLSFRDTPIIYTSELILRSTICIPSATWHNIHMYPYFLSAVIHHLKSSPTFSVRPCSSAGRVTVDLICRSWVPFPPRSKDFFFASGMVPCFPLLGLTPNGLFMGLSSTIIYTSELILCSTICCSTWAARVIPNQNSFKTKNDFVKASTGEFSKTQ